jgi:hypothetical protein
MDELDLIKYSTAIELLEKTKLLVNKVDSIQINKLIQTFTDKVETYKDTVPTIVRPTNAEISRVKEGWKKMIKVKYLAPILTKMREDLGEEPYPDNFDTKSLNESELKKYYDDMEQYYAKEDLMNGIYQKIKNETYVIFENTIKSFELLNRRILLSRTIKENGESPENRFLVDEINKKMIKFFEAKNKQFIDDKLLGVYKKISIK